MTSSKTMRTTMLAALAGVVAVLGLLAGPAGAQTSGPGTSGGARATDDSVASGTCVAVDDSVCSGSGHARDDSTASGAATAIDGSTASGCSLATDDATASGGPCRPGPGHDDKPKPGPKPGGDKARPGAAAGRTLALTGPSSTTVVATGAALALVVGSMLVLATRRPAES